MAKNTNTQVQVSNDYSGMLYGGITASDIETIKATIAKDCDMDQFKLFMGQCRSIDANPMIGEAFPSVYAGKLTVQYAVDLYVRKAKETPGYLGYDVQLVYDKDDFEANQIDMGDGRSWMKVTHKVNGIRRGQLIGGYAIAYREGMIPFVVIMDIDDISHLENSNIGMQAKMWKTYKPDMFKKHMAKRALKGQFGLIITGDTELEGPKMIDVTDYTEVQEGYQEASATSEGGKVEIISGGGTVTENEPVTTTPEIERLRSELSQRAKQLDVGSKSKVAGYCTLNGLTLSKEWDNASELAAVISSMDQDIMDLEMSKEI